MKLTHNLIPFRWRAAATGVLLVWIMCRGVCVANPVWLDEHHDTVITETVSAERETAHASPYRSGHDRFRNSGTADAPHHDHPAHGPKSTGDSDEEPNPCDDDCCADKSILAKLNGTPKEDYDHARWTAACVPERRLGDHSIVGTPKRVTESPPVVLRDLSVLLLGPGHLPHGPPLL